MPASLLFWLADNWADVDALGGLPVVMKSLAKHGLLHTDCLTVSGKTVAENLEGIPDLQDLPAGQDVLFPVSAPWADKGNHISVLRGSLSPCDPNQALRCLL